MDFFAELTMDVDDIRDDANRLHDAAGGDFHLAKTFPVRRTVTGTRPATPRSEPTGSRRTRRSSRRPHTIPDFRRT
ncbi:hypothetical protein ACH41H_02210 [Streptomyces sp. NPDC020800]|uniref:hypothetical protein n=1 Tax=Streptomyces sp. NPDC020800 TaxID=3365092 RepID=UPI0037B6ED03